MKNAIINQPAGLGDILFCYKLAAKLCENDFKVTWPVIPQYLSDIKKYIKPHPNIEFVDGEKDFSLKHFSMYEMSPIITEQGDFYLPLTFADRHFQKGESFLKTKYKLFQATQKALGLDELEIPYDSWSEPIELIRDENKEKTLFYDVLGLEDSDYYILVNKKYGTYPDVRVKNFSIAESCKIIELDALEGYSLFDWCLVIERAKKIYSVDTSLFFLIELLDLKDTELFAYSRHSHFIHVDDLFTANWIYKYE